MEYLDPNKYFKLSAALLSSELSEGDCLRITDSIIDFQNKLYIIKCPHSFEEELDVIKFAIKETEQTCNNLDFFTYLYEKNIIINRERVEESIKSLLEKAKKKEYLKLLKPKSIHYLHGDLHPENFFIDKDDVKKIKIIDPVAPLGIYFGDIVFDLAKLESYFSGLLYQLRQGLFTISEKTNGNQVKYIYEMKQDQSFQNFFNKNAPILFGKINGNLERNWLNEDPTYKTRKHFYDFLYYFTMVPIVKQPQNKLRLIMSISCLNKFFSEIK